MLLRGYYGSQCTRGFLNRMCYRNSCFTYLFTYHMLGSAVVRVMSYFNGRYQILNLCVYIYITLNFSTPSMAVITMSAISLNVRNLVNIYSWGTSVRMCEFVTFLPFLSSGVAKDCAACAKHGPRSLRGPLGLN